MADEEPKIPVFSVLKNGVILKNIFMVNNPSAADNTDRASEVILNVGRHKDCHVLLTHPSISRFHLRIFSNPSSQKLFVMDLSSVHGTWVNYTKIEPWTRVELNEGDTLRVGSSSRVHKLHWVPLNQANDTKCSFLSSLVEEKEEETAENNEGDTAQADRVKNEKYVEQKRIREERDSNVLPIDDDRERTAKIEETVGAYWDDLLKIDYGEHKYPLEDIDEILASGEGEVLETAKFGEIVSENQAHDIEYSYLSAQGPSSVEEKEEKAADSRGLIVQVDKNDPLNGEPREYGEYRDTLEQIGRDIVATDEEKGETAKVEEETKEAYWVGSHLFTDWNGEFGEYTDQLAQRNEHIPACGEDATEASQQTANEAEVSEEINEVPLKGMLEPNSEVASLDMTFDSLGSSGLNESGGLFVREETPMRLPVPQRMGSSSSDEEITHISAEIDFKGGENCIACSEFAFSEWMTFSLPTEILLEEILLNSDEEETLEVGLATQSAYDVVDDNLRPQYVDSGSCLPDENLGEFDSESYEEANRSSECALLESASLLLPEVLGETNWQISGAETPILPCIASESELIPEIDNPRESKTKQNADVIESIDASLEGQGNHSASSVEGERQNTKDEKIDEELSTHLDDPDADSCLLHHENQIVLFSFSRRHIPFTETSTPRLWSRIGKPATIIQLQTDKRSRKSRSTGFNAENRHQIKENAENIYVVRDLSADLDRVEEETFYPEKENMTPNSLKLRFMREIGKFGRVESPSGQLSSYHTKEGAFNSLNGEPQTPVEENIAPSLLSESFLSQDEQFSNSSSCMETSFIPKIFLKKDVLNSSTEENQTPKSSPKPVIPEVNLRERSLFQSSQVEPESISELSTAQSNKKMRPKVSAPVAQVASSNKTWIMVADMSSLVDKESRKSLQLLQGLRGTQLVIPQISMRELDSLKNNSRFFGRKTEPASVLEWIEEAMVLDSKWWIHIQSSSVEEERSIAPTAEAHVLDYALFIRKTNANAHTVLLTNDISLKIKAMAEGLLCETPQEFRVSLVNPFSHRFMWSGSSPRGQTWSCPDDIVLKDRYCQAFGNDGVKGLKLVLSYTGKSYY